jgi:hypothetical protein
VTFLSGIGTLIVIFGVILYNEGRDPEKKMDHTPVITWREV